MVSKITDKILPQVKEWQSRPLNPVYPFVFMDCIHYKVREDGRILSRAAYVVPGVTVEGYKDIFDSRIIINSTAKFYISISYQKNLLSIDTRIFTPSRKIQCPTLISVYHSVCSPEIHRVLQVL